MATNPKKKLTKEEHQIEELKQQLAEITEALQRERADATNVRRRAEEDRLRMASYFKASVIKELLPFVDNFDRALSNTPKTNEKAFTDWLQGLHGVNKQLWQTLQSLGVKKIETIGQKFDPKYHEAVQMDSESEGSEEVITEEFMSGYTIDDEVIRHAMVKVAMR